MTLMFPNPSRSFDEARHAVRFHGHDGMFEVAFLIDAAALAGTAEQAASDTACLAAFDAAREAIEDGARRAYSRAPRKIHFLTAADLA